ncbi:MAG: hypothetical protein ACFB9M_14775 [Myxococcota bacterium]
MGALLFWLPIPLGAPLIAVGLALLVSSSHSVRRWLRGLRKARPDVDRWLEVVEDRLPPKMARTLKRTRARHLTRET